MLLCHRKRDIYVEDNSKKINYTYPAININKFNFKWV